MCFVAFVLWCLEWRDCEAAWQKDERDVEQYEENSSGDTVKMLESVELVLNLKVMCASICRGHSLQLLQAAP